MEKSNRERVGIYLDAHTRDRLNKFVADQRLATGKMMSQSAAIDLLLDNYASAHQAHTNRVPEYA